MPKLGLTSNIHDQHVRINLEQRTFKQIIDDLSNIFKVQIDLMGNTKDLPKDKFDLNLEQTTLDQNIKEAMRKANIQNYVMLFNQKDKAVRIWILQSVPEKIENLPQTKQSERARKILSLSQLQQLESEDDYKHNQLTPEQMQQLESGDDSNKKALTTEQMQQLDPYNDNINANRTLSKEQMQLLDQEEQKRPKTLTKEQMRLLESDMMTP